MGLRIAWQGLGTSLRHRHSVKHGGAWFFSFAAAPMRTSENFFQQIETQRRTLVSTPFSIAALDRRGGYRAQQNRDRPPVLIQAQRNAFNPCTV